MTSRTIVYRAVHTITRWRKVRNHTSLYNALYGSDDGAPGLFARRVRTDYAKHGDPLYAVIWEDGEKTGYVVKKDASASDGVARVEVPIEVLLGYEERGGVSSSELEAHFRTARSDKLLQHHPEKHLTRSQGEEGTARLQEHLVRERDASLAEAKKQAILIATGRLACEACDFDFGATYGEVGAGFCEVHHLNPLATRGGSETTSLEDLAILCSNCHSIIHRTFPMWSVKTLTEHLASRTKKSDVEPQFE
ncbi:HNH endonuclease family protein [Burkholderia cenocepacia]|uniref:HNH endonuclease family protein n=1 Tax=Burkholderia cenocepacia TaxID=95486 RepID=A0AAN0RT75_9BURK|nr:HNH endonuclease family protein [Burkholderia cenocepacia]